MNYQRKLNPSEVERHFIYIPKGITPLFPPAHQKFTLQVKDKNVEVELDKTYRIWSGKFSDKINWILDSTIKITKNTDGVYILEQSE